MKMAELSIAVLMQRRTQPHRWVDEAWAAIAVVTAAEEEAGTITPLQQSAQATSYLVSGLRLELYPDENEGYFENWAAPEPKVFVLWRLQDGRAMPVQASVSYAEGTRMFDSGEAADGVAMPADIHAWLGDYLRQHYQPPPRRGRHRPADDADAPLNAPCAPAPDPSAA